MTKTTWNHRVFRQEEPDGDSWFTIREAHYSEDKDVPRSWTKTAVAPGGATLDELRSELELMLRALDKPVLEDRD